MSRNLRNFERNLDLLDIEQQKSVNLLKKLSLSQFVEHIIDTNEPPVQENNTEAETTPTPGNADPYKCVLDLSISSLSTTTNSYMTNEMHPDASSIGGDNNKKPLPLIIGSDEFNSVHSIQAPTSSTLQKQMTISQIGGPMSSSVIKIPQASNPSLPSSSNTTVQMEPIANNPSIPTPPPIAPSIPPVPSSIPSFPPVPLSVPSSVPPVPSSIPSVPPVPTQPPNSSFPSVAMQPNVGGPGVPLPPPLIIPSVKPPQPKSKAADPPKKKIVIQKERPKTMQELLAEQREKMKKGGGQKACPPLPTTDPETSVKPQTFPFKLPGMKAIEDTKDDDDKMEAIQVGLHNLKLDTKQGTETEEKSIHKPIIQIKKDPRLELAGKRLNDVFGDDEDDIKPEDQPAKQQQPTTTNDVTKKINQLLQKDQPPVSTGMGMKMPGLPNQFKPSPPLTTTSSSNNTSTNQEENKPPGPGGFGNKLSNLEKLFASGFGMGMSVNMAQTQPSTNDHSNTTADTGIQVQKSEYETIIAKNTSVIHKKKPKKKAFGAGNSTGNTQLNQTKTVVVRSTNQNTKPETKQAVIDKLLTASTIKPEMIRPGKFNAKDLFTDIDDNIPNTNNPPADLHFETLAKSSVTKPTKNIFTNPQQKPAATKRLSFLFEDEEE